MKQLVIGCVLTAQVINFVSTQYFPIRVEENVKDIELFNITYPFEGSPACSLTRLDLAASSLSSWFDLGPMIQLPSGEYQRVVNLVKAFDYEEDDIHEVTAEAVCPGFGQALTWQYTIIVSDTIDTPPQFTKDIYTASIPENTAIGTTILSRVIANEVDNADVVAFQPQLSEEQSKMFRTSISVEPIPGNPSALSLNFILSSPLDYETETVHQFIVLAVDRANLTDSCQVTIHVEDVQDMPPSFSLPFYGGQVSEDAPLGSSVLTVSAYDGDLSINRNDVTYSIKEGSRNLFAIDNTTGVVTVTGRMDVDHKTDMASSQIRMVVEAKEVNTSMESQFGNTTTTVQVQIAILDVDDNTPEFSAASYAGTIRQDARMNEMVSMEGGFISVSDGDQMPSHNQFRLHIEKDGIPWPVFEPSVTTVFAQASVLIVLKQPEALKDKASTHMKFQIVATEMSAQAANRSTATADIALWVASPAPQSETIVDIPIRTSDVIIFIIGFVILFNMILTILLCRIFRKQNNMSGAALFNRNHKYCVSERDTSTSTTGGGRSKRDKQNNGDVEGYGNQKDLPKLSPPKEANDLNVAVMNANPPLLITNTVASALNRSRCDVVPVSEGQNENTGNGIVQETTPRCDVTPLKPLHSPLPTAKSAEESKFVTPQEQQEDTFRTSGCDVVPHESNTSLSNILQRVQQKLSSVNKNLYNDKSDTFDLRPITEDSSLESSFTDISYSNNSSFSGQAKCDVTPLIHSHGAQNKNKHSKENDRSGLARVNHAFTENDVESNGKVPVPSSIQGSDSKDEVTPKRHAPPVPFASSHSYVPPLNASQTQLSQTGVPPVALALPFSTAVIPKEKPVATVINPVFTEDSPVAKTTDPNSGRSPAASIWSDGCLTTTQATEVKRESGQQNNTKSDATPPGNTTPEQAENTSTARPLHKTLQTSRPQKNEATSSEEIESSDTNRGRTHPLNVQQTTTIPTSTQNMTQSEPALNAVPDKQNNPDFLVAAKKLLRTASSSRSKSPENSQGQGSKVFVQRASSITKPPRKTPARDDDNKLPAGRLTQL